MALAGEVSVIPIRTRPTLTTRCNLLVVLWLFASAGLSCSPRFPDIYYSVTAVEVRHVHWLGGGQMAVEYALPRASQSHSRGAEVRETEERVELRFVQRYGSRWTAAPVERVEFANPERLPVVVTDDVETILIWGRHDAE